ncbi:MAG: hypothetical protein J7448_11545, partial [Thermomicrobium sp.]|nr:hypothetical protein [Thermomicrobium sp.]
MTTSVEDLPAVRALLRFGYVLEWKDDPAKGWRCTIVSDDERWEGEGPDQQAALEDALHRLAPSKIARKLLERAGADVVELGSKSGVRIAAGVDVGAGLQPGSRDLPAMLADLQTIAARVEAGISEVALMAPPLQKLHVLAWISHARAIEQEAGKHRAVIEATGAIARRLTTLSKTWWPGSVRALQVDATPEGAAREQGLPPASRWIEVAEAAEERLETAIAEPPGDD